MSLLGWSFFGFTLGMIFRSLFLRHDSLGLVGLCVLGIFGGLLGGGFGVALGLYAPDEGAGFIGATLGAAAILTAYSFVVSRQSKKQVPIKKSETPRRAA